MLPDFTLLSFRLRAVLLIPLLGFLVPGSAQLPSFTHFDQLTIREGLSSNSHNTVFKDSKGLVWITSQDGLNRYDGMRIKKYYHNDRDSFSLSNNWTTAAEEDVEGRLWVSTFQGICRYDRKKDRFEPFRFHYTPSPVVFAEKFPGTWQGQWVFNINGNLVFKNTRNGQEKIYPIITGSGRKDFSLLPFGKYFLMGMINGLYFFDSQTGKMLDSIPLTKGVLRHSFDHTITSFYQDAAFIWISTWSGGLVRVDKQTGVIKQYPLDKKFPLGYGGSNICFNILEKKDANGQRYFLLGANLGLAVFYPEQESFHIVANVTADKNKKGIAGWPMHIYEDNEGILWIEQSAEGVAIYKPEKNFFEEVLVPNRYAVRTHSLNQVLTDKRDATGNTLWISSFGSGLIKYHLQQGLLDQYYETQEAQQDFNFIEELFQQSNGTLWIANPVCRSVNETRHTSTLPRDKASGRDIYARSVIEDKEKNLWFACHDTLVKMNARGDCFYYGLPDFFIKKGQHISTVAWDAEREYIWFSSFNGIGYFDTRHARFSDEQVSRQWAAIENAEVSFVDNQGRLFISGQRGVWLLNRNNFRPRHFTTSDGLPSNICYHALQDNHSNYWLNTGNGLCKISADLATIQNFGQEDGVIGSHLDTKICRLQDGRLVLPYVNYLQTWDPAHFDRLKKAPGFFITDILVNGQVYSDYTAKENGIDLRLRHNQNSIQLNVGLNQYMFSANRQIRYRINGGDWLPVTSQQLSLILQPAVYKIELAGRATNTAWSETPYTVFITIAPPFWRTGWFNLFVLAAVAAMAYGLYRYRIGQILKLQRVRNTIAQDLHDDVGSTMTTISILSQVARQKLASEKESGPLLDEIGNNSRELLGKLDDIVWSVNPGNDSLQQMSLRMKQLAIDLLGNKGVRMEFIMPDQLDGIPLAMQNRRNVYLVYKEALHNIAKYAAASTVTVQVNLSHKQLVLTIRDNGKGFDKEEVAANGRSGLTNMQQRAKQAGGNCTIISVPGAGTTITLKVPLG